MKINETFSIDGASTSEVVYVDVEGRGTVAIRIADDGLVVDVYPPETEQPDQPVASTWASLSDLIPNSEEERDPVRKGGK